ncbi:MAG: hypothetical protein DLM54_00760 [Acidimicrobiales bacterium]|nr:MAG: hypothetical protein DLM54_00760 [Acidimicrobiales bacterium]
MPGTEDLSPDLSHRVPDVPPDRPPPDPVKLLAYWMEWERATTPPGRVMANLKTAGLRELLEALVDPARAGS